MVMSTGSRCQLHGALCPPCPAPARMRPFGMCALLLPSRRSISCCPVWGLVTQTVGLSPDELRRTQHTPAVKRALILVPQPVQARHTVVGRARVVVVRAEAVVCVVVRPRDEGDRGVRGG